MNNRVSISRKYRRLFLSFFLPFFGYLMVMLIAQHTPFGKYSILYSDMYHQYYPFFVNFRATLLSGKSLLYNWDIGMGLDYLGLISYYLASPLNLLSVVIPESFLLEYFSLLVPVKLGLAGLFFGLFLEQVFQKRDWSVPVFAAAYGLCAWALGYQWNIMWLDTFALLPLVVLGMVSLLKERKFILYTISLFFAIACNYYIGFFVCIFVALCFFSYQISYAKSFGRFFQDLGLIFLFSLLAIGMTAFLEYPTLIALGNTYSSVNKFPTSFSLNIADEATWKGLLDAMRQVAGNATGGHSPTFKEGLPNIYCGILPLILAVQYFFNKRFRLRERLCNLFLLVFFMLSFILRQLDYIWHGFHFTNMIPYRFSFLFSFIVLILAYRSFLDLRNAPKWRTVVSLVITLGLMACSDSRTDTVFLIYNLVFLAVNACLLLSVEKPKLVREEVDGNVVAVLTPLTKQQKRKNRHIPYLLSGAILLELVCSLVNFGVNFGGTLITDYPRGTVDSQNVIAYMQSLEPDTVYYRAETNTTQTLNDDALNGYSGITLFSSSANVRVTKMMAALGYGAKPSYNRYAYENGSPVSNLFLNLKYLITRNTSALEDETFSHVYNMGNVHLQENLAYLPLGFMVGHGVLNMSSESDSAGTFAFQNELFRAATGLNTEVLNTNVFFTGESDDGIKVTAKSQPGSYTYTTNSTTGSVTIKFTVPDDGVVCVDLHVSKKNKVSIYRNGVSLYSESLGLDQMLSLGSCAAGDLIELEFACKNQNETGAIAVEAAVMNSDIFWEGYDILNTSVLNLRSIDGTVATGSVVVAGENTILYTSIPYDENWIVEVDGQPVEVIALLDSMVGVELEPGTHNVVFRYHNSAFYQGLAMSAASLVLFLGIIALTAWRKRRGSSSKKDVV